MAERSCPVLQCLELCFRRLIDASWKHDAECRLPAEVHQEIAPLLYHYLCRRGGKRTPHQISQRVNRGLALVFFVDEVQKHTLQQSLGCERVVREEQLRVVLKTVNSLGKPVGNCGLS